MVTVMGDVTYRSAPGVCWVQERTSLIVVDEATGRQVILRDEAMAVWNWLALAYPYATVVRLLAVLLDAPAEEAAARLADLLAGWCAAGLFLAETPGAEEVRGG